MTGYEPSIVWASMIVEVEPPVARCQGESRRRKSPLIDVEILSIQFKRQPTICVSLLCEYEGHKFFSERFGSGDGEREASMTRQMPYEPLPASVLLGVRLGKQGISFRVVSR
jgi:hypothetical protein